MGNAPNACCTSREKEEDTNSPDERSRKPRQDPSSSAQGFPRPLGWDQEPMRPRVEPREPNGHLPREPRQLGLRIEEPQQERRNYYDRGEVPLGGGQRLGVATSTRVREPELRENNFLSSGQRIGSATRLGLQSDYPQQQGVNAKSYQEWQQQERQQQVWQQQYQDRLDRQNQARQQNQAMQRQPSPNSVWSSASMAAGGSREDPYWTSEAVGLTVVEKVPKLQSLQPVQPAPQVSSSRSVGMPAASSFHAGQQQPLMKASSFSQPQRPLTYEHGAVQTSPTRNMPPTVPGLVMPGPASVPSSATQIQATQPQLQTSMTQLQAPAAQKQAPPRIAPPPLQSLSATQKSLSATSDSAGGPSTQRSAGSFVVKLDCGPDDPQGSPGMARSTTFGEVPAPDGLQQLLNKDPSEPLLLERRSVQ